MTKSQSTTDMPSLQSHFNTNIGAWTLDCISSKILFDDAARAIIRSTTIHTEHPTLKDFFSTLYPENGHSLALQFYDFIAQNDHFLYRDCRVTDTTGQPLWIRMQGSVTQRGDDRRPLLVHGTIVDVSQEKREQKNLRRETQRAHYILHGVNIGTWEWFCKKDSVIIDQKAQEILGFSEHKSPQDVFSSWFKRIHKDDKFLVEKGVNDILVNNESSFSSNGLEYRFEKTPNNFIWIQVKGHKPPGKTHQLSTVGGTIIDITQRKTAELSALRFKQHINNVIEATDMGSWEWHCRTDTWEFNSRFLSMFGWDQDQRVNRKTVKASIHHNDFAKEHPRFKEFILGRQEIYQGDFRVRHKDRHWIWVRTFARRKGTRKNQRRQTITGYNLDITEQKTNEIRLAATQSYSHKLNICSKELLQDNEDSLQKALEHLHEAANSSRVHLFQISPDDSGEKCLQLTHECLKPGIPSEKEHLAAYSLSPKKFPFHNWGKHLQAGKYICGCRENFSPEESAFLLSINTQTTIMVPMFSKGLWLGLVCFEEKSLKRIWTNDEISFVQHCAEIIGSYILRKTTEQDLIKSEERLRSMMENGSQGIWETDTKGDLTYFTHGALFPDRSTFATSSVKNIFDFLSPEDKKRNLKTLAKCIKSKESFPSQRNWLTKTDGTRACYSTSAIPLLDAKDELIGFRGIYSDITQEVMREMQVQESQKMQALGKLAGGVAHDFNNQLTGIMGYATLLLEGIPQEDHATFIQNILTCAKRSADLTQQLLTFSKHSQIRSDRVDLIQIINEIYSILSHSIDKKIQLEKDFPQTSLAVKGDSSLLQNALLNFALNAKDSVEDAGKISIQAYSVQLSPAACELMSYDIQAGDYAKITLSDTGCGMDEETLQRIFEPFFSTKGTQGTGMGLATAHGTIIQHGGAIEVRSQVGKGTHFTIFLPLCEDRPVSHVLQENNGSLPNFQHVVLIDDEEHILEIGSIYLQNQGYRVTSIDNGKDAISYIQKNYKDIDLVISDIIMPDVNGWQVFQATKQIIETPNFVFVSGYNDEVDNAQMREAGITAFIPKPFTRKHFLTTIAKAFDKEE